MTPIPVAISTGSLYPLSTLQSIAQFKEKGFRDIELVLQAHEFSLTFERKLSMPIFPELLALVRRVNAREFCPRPAIRTEHATTLGRATNMSPFDRGMPIIGWKPLVSTLTPFDFAGIGAGLPFIERDIAPVCFIARYRSYFGKSTFGQGCPGIGKHPGLAR